MCAPTDARLLSGYPLTSLTGCLGGSRFGVVGEKCYISTHTLVAQWIEQQFPKLWVGSSSLPKGTVPLFPGFREPLSRSWRLTAVFPEFKVTGPGAVLKLPAYSSKGGVTVLLAVTSALEIGIVLVPEPSRHFFQFFIGH